MKGNMKMLVVMTMLSLFVAQASVFANGESDEPATGPKEQKQYVLKLAHGVTTTDPLHASAEKFKELAESYTNGRVKIEIYPNGLLGDEQAIVQTLRSGAVDMGLVYTGNAQSLAPSIGVVMLPYLFKSSEEAWYALDAILPAMNEQLIEEAGIRALSFYEKGFRVLTNSKRPVKNLTDLKGLKIRVSPTEVPIKTFKSWGINPIPMAWGEVFTALQQNVIDGQENPYTTIPAVKFQEVQKYITEIHYMLWTGPLLISEKSYNVLPEDIQEQLIRAASDSVIWSRDLGVQLKEEAIKKCIDAGMILSGVPEDEDEWQKKAQSVWPSLYDTVGGKAWVNKALGIMQQ